MAELVVKRAADVVDDLGLGAGGLRHRIGDAAGGLARHQAKDLGGLRDLQLRQDDRGGLGTFGLERGGDTLVLDLAKRFPRIVGVAKAELGPRAARDGRGKLVAKRLERAAHRAGEEKADRVEFGKEFVDDARHGVAVDGPDPGHVEDELVLRLFGEVGERQFDPGLQEQPDDDSRLLHAAEFGPRTRGSCGQRAAKRVEPARRGRGKRVARGSACCEIEIHGPESYTPLG